MAGVQHFGNFRASPAWAGDFGGREHILPWPAKIDAAAFSDQGAVVVTAAAAAAQNATSITVEALTPPGSAATTLNAQGGVLIPAGTTLHFGGAKVATLTADAAIGATTLSVSAIPTAIADDDVARFSRYGTLYIPSGTVVGRTWAERNANTPFGPGANTDNELFLTVFDTADARASNDIELYRPGSLVKENYLPGYGATGVLGTSASPTALLTALRGVYECITGKD